MDNNVEVLIAKASLYETKGEWDKYIESYEKGIEISPLDLSCMVNLAFGYYFTQRFDDALVYNTMATNMAPEAAWNHLTKAFIIFGEMGANIESREALERINEDHDWYLYAFYFQEIFEGNFETALSLVEKYPNGIDHKATRSPKELLAAFMHNHLNHHS